MCKPWSKSHLMGVLFRQVATKMGDSPIAMSGVAIGVSPISVAIQILNNS